MYKKRGVPKEYNGFLSTHKSLIAITTLVGTVVGAGVLGIPAVVAKAGLLYGFFLILLLGFAFVFINLFAGEFVLRTKGKHQLTGYAGKYLGKWGKRGMVLAMVFGIYGALTAYLIGEGETLFSIFKFGSPLLYTLLFFAITAIIVWKGIKATGRAELILISLLIIIVGLIGIFSFDQIDLNNFSTFNPAFFLLPYGIILFSFMGTPAIPELREELEKDKKLMRNAIIIGSLIPIFIYLIFTFVIVGVVGVDNFELLEPNQRIATIALSMYSHQILGILANILAALAMFTSFLTMALAMIQMYTYDYKISQSKAFLLTFSLPLIPS